VPSFVSRLEDGWSRGREVLALALVPLATSLLATDKIRAVVAAEGHRGGFAFGLPAAVVDLWTFVSVPNDGVGATAAVPATGLELPFLAVALPLGVALKAALAAGYFGSIEDALREETYSFSANARRYFLPFLAYTLVPTLLVLPFVLGAGLGLGTVGVLGPLVLLLVLAFLLAIYLFFATPYLVVLRECGLVAAARRSLELALAGGAYLRYALGFALFVLFASLAVTLFVVNLGIVGVLLGALATAPVGLACNVATMRFVADIDPPSPSLGDWSGGDDLSRDDARSGTDVESGAESEANDRRQGDARGGDDERR
jgi:hypothetical protein